MLKNVLQFPESSDSLAGSAEGRKIIRCDKCAAERAAVCAVELRFLCMNHFVAYCYLRLAETEKGLIRDEGRKSVRGFLRECATQAAKLLLMGQQLPNADRARLFDVMVWANELFHRSIAKPTIDAGKLFRAADNLAASS
jgi:hypothetical protein